MSFHISLQTMWIVTSLPVPAMMFWAWNDLFVAHMPTVMAVLTLGALRVFDNDPERAPEWFLVHLPVTFPPGVPKKVVIKGLLRVLNNPTDAKFPVAFKRSKIVKILYEILARLESTNDGRGLMLTKLTPLLDAVSGYTLTKHVCKQLIEGQELGGAARLMLDRLVDFHFNVSPKFGYDERLVLFLLDNMQPFTAHRSLRRILEHHRSMTHRICPDASPRCVYCSVPFIRNGLLTAITEGPFQNYVAILCTCRRIAHVACHQRFLDGVGDRENIMACPGCGSDRHIRFLRRHLANAIFCNRPAIVRTTHRFYRLAPAFSSPCFRFWPSQEKNIICHTRHDDENYQYDWRDRFPRGDTVWPLPF